MTTGCVVLLSGGLDSATVLAIATRERGLRASCLTFDYGQRHRHEIDCARRVAWELGAASHRVLGLDPAIVAGSELTGGGDVPRDLDPGRGGIPDTYVPARNTLFLAHALAESERAGTELILIGANAVDYSGYPDCRPEYLQAFECMANLATREAVEGRARYRVEAPLLRMAKGEIVAKGSALGLDFALTSSCYDPSEDGAACGRCDSCALRARGFAAAGLRDPRARPAQPAM